MTNIYKFGGSSLASAEKINQVAKFIAKRLSENPSELVVVVSAMGKTTNALDSLAHETGGEKVKQNAGAGYAKLVAAGEYISACALSLALKKQGIESDVLTADNLVFAEGENYTSENIKSVNTERLKQVLKNKVAIVCGFQGVNKNGERVLLGRGGSDTTAVALGAALGAKVYIYTDVNGFYTLDPNTFSGAKQLSSISAHSALSLASGGAKVLDKRALMVANKFKTPVEVLKSCESGGTRLETEPLESAHIDGISFVKNAMLLEGDENAESAACTIYKRLAIKRGDRVKTFIVALPASGSLPPKKSCPCDLLTIAGSGLDYYKQFLQTLKAVLSQFKNQIKLIDISPTAVYLVCTQGSAQKISECLAKTFNLVKKSPIKK